MSTKITDKLAAAGLGASLLLTGGLASAQSADDLSPSAVDRAVPESVSVESGIFSGSIAQGDGRADATVVPTTAAVKFKPYKGEVDSFSVVGTMGATYARIGGDEAALPNNPLIGGFYHRKLGAGFDMKLGVATVVPIARAGRSIAAAGYKRVAAMHGFWAAAPWVPDRMASPMLAALGWGAGGTKLGAQTLFIPAPSVVEDPSANMLYVWAQRAGVVQKVEMFKLGLHGIGSWNIRGETYAVAIEPSVAAKAGPVTVRARGMLPVSAPTGAFYEATGTWAAFLSVGVAIPRPGPPAAQTATR